MITAFEKIWHIHASFKFLARDFWIGGNSAPIQFEVSKGSVIEPILYLLYTEEILTVTNSFATIFTVDAFKSCNSITKTVLVIRPYNGAQIISKMMNL